MIQELIKSTSVKEVMASPVITVNDRDDFHVVQEKFEVHGIRHLPVIDANQCLVGVITQRQLYKIHSPRRLENGEWFYDRELLDGFILRNVMIKDVYTLTADAKLKDVMALMLQFKFGCIPIIDDARRPVGIVTRDNIIKFFLSHA